MAMCPGAIRKLKGVNRVDYLDTAPDYNLYSTTVSVKDADGAEYKCVKVTNEALETQLTKNHETLIRIQMNDLAKYEGNCRNLFYIVRGQIDPRMMELLTVDPSYEQILEDEDLIEFLKLIKNACNSNSGEIRTFGPNEWMTSAYSTPVRQISKNSKKVLPIREYVQMVIDKYMALTSKNGRFVYGTNFWDHVLKKDGKTFEDYMVMNKADKQKYDDLANDLITATLIIQNCGQPNLLRHLSNQFATNNQDCYPENPIEAAALLDTFDSSDSKNVVDNANDGIVSAHVTNVPEIVSSVATSDDISIAGSYDIAQEVDTEQNQEIEDPSPEPDALKASVMAAVVAGTLPDQDFRDEDEDSWSNGSSFKLACAITASIPIPSAVTIQTSDQNGEEAKINSSAVVSDEDDPSYSIDEWHDCQQEDNTVSGPDNDVNASNSSASSNPL